MPKKEYDDRLRCSPLRKFEQHQANIPPGAKPAAASGLDFSTSKGSSNLGSAPLGRSSRRHYHTEQAAPVRVDAMDGFDERESSGEPETDADLAGRVLATQMHLNMEPPEFSLGSGRGGRWQARTAGRGPGRIPVPIPLAYKLPVRVPMPSVSMHTSDMISAMRGLDSLVVPYGPTDVAMSDADSVLGKRAAEQKDLGQVEDVGESNTHNQPSTTVRAKAKKGKVKGNQEEKVDVHEDMEMDGKVNKEATSLGAAGKLTGPTVAPHREP